MKATYMQIQGWKHSATAPKDALGRIYDGMIKDGAKKDADKLMAIIMRLEAWQNR